MVVSASENNFDYSVYDYVDQAIFVLVPDANNRPVYQYLNACALRELGVSLEAVQGMPAYELFEGRAACSVYRRECAAWANGEAAEYEVALSAGGETRWMRVKLRPIHDEQGRLTQMVGTSQNITPEREQLQNHTFAAASAHEIEELVCLAARDLRTPIDELKSITKLLRIDFVERGDGKAELIDQIDEIAGKALLIMSNLMGQAMMTDSIQQDCQRFDLGFLCDDIMVLLDPTEKHSVSYPRQMIEADGTVLQIVLQGLIDNAMTHCGVEDAQISVEIEQMNAERFLFIVSDGGEGFDLTLETDDAGIPHRSPFGFGLRGIQRLMRGCGGRVDVMPTVIGQGAQVHFELPGRIVPAAAVVDLERRIA